MSIQIKINPQAVRRIIEVRSLARRIVQVGIQGAPGRDGADSIIYESAETDENAIVGQPLYLKLSGHAGLAQANAIGTCRVCGVVVQNAIATTAVQYSFNYPVERTDWTLITGTTYLSPGATYYLDPSVPGRLTTIAPELSGQLVAIVGSAVSPLRLAVNVQIPILL